MLVGRSVEKYPWQSDGAKGPGPRPSHRLTPDGDHVLDVSRTRCLHRQVMRGGGEQYVWKRVETREPHPRVDLASLYHPPQFGVGPVWAHSLRPCPGTVPRDVPMWTVRSGVTGHPSDTSIDEG